MNILTWISSVFEQAALRGIASAVAKLELAQEEGDPLAALTERMSAPVAITTSAAPEPTGNGESTPSTPSRRRGARS